MARSGKENRTRHTGSSPSEKQNKKKAASVHSSPTPAKGAPAPHLNERNFDMVVDGVPYSVRSAPFLFNDELRYRVRINGGPEHLFTWDSQAKMLRAIDDESSTIPSVVEEALSERLQSK